MIDDNVLSVFGHIVSAIDGKASHGYEAEVYAYLLLPYCLGVVTKDDYLRAEGRLIEVCYAIKRIYDKTCLINGLTIEDWKSQDKLFDHRVMVSFLN